MNSLKRALQIFADHYDAKSLRKKPTSMPMPKSKKDDEDEHKDLKSKPMPKAEIKYKKTAKDQLSGGLADGMDDDDFDPKQLEMGEQVEYEHTNDKDISREISKDHLYEISDYYSRLAEMEDGAKEDGTLNEEAEEKLDEKAEARKNASLIVLCHRCEDNIEECDCEAICPACKEEKDNCSCVCQKCERPPSMCSCEDEKELIEDIIDPDVCENCGNLIDDCECPRCDGCCKLIEECECECEKD